MCQVVEALCADHQTNLIKVEDSKKLGEWEGLCGGEGLWQSLRQKVSSRSTSNARNEQRNLAFVSQTKNK